MSLRLLKNHARFYSSSSSIREQILDLSLQNVKSHGWTEKSVTLACEKLGLSPMAYNIGYVDGLGLINHFFDKALINTTKAAQDPAFPDDFKERVKYLCKARLEQTIPYADQWQQSDLF
ncbi:hypothetical protein BB561_000213 [Smittium simulii]|uniref:Ubiquinone biosynthesis protein n=1 Tax=Smittium simulii TaxID=133385 RepID=A0A2T9Z049_9FUNG|nr:hypothetical protein BB561_000213 [Smittium simulii]